MERSLGTIIIYTDGSSIGNPGPGGWGAIISYPSGTVKELGGFERHTTNNKMELVGAIKSLEYLTSATEPVKVITDSSYLVNGITKWVHGWQKSGWITSTKQPVLNKELWEDLYALTKKLSVSWEYAPGHAGVPGNERVDEIAQGLARGEKVKLYEGGYEKYGIDLTPEVRAAGSVRGKKPYSYLSLVDGNAMRHETWAECEARVKGKAGAKFKKTFSSQDEARVLKEWKVSL